MLAITMLALATLCAVLLKVWTEERSRRQWISRKGQTALELASQSPTQLCLPKDHFYLYQPTLGSWIGQFAWWATVFLASAWLWVSCDAMRSKPPNDPSSATGRDKPNA